MGTTFGSFGVDLFFVLSGFVIAMASEKNVGAIQFAINRITRVVPLYWLMTTILLMVVILRPELFNSTTASIPNYLKSIFFIPYFRENGQLQPMLGVGWTLNYEMIFYAMATVSLSASPTRFYCVTCVLVTLMSGMGCLLLDGTPYADFLRSNLLFEFMLGMAAFKLKDSAYLRKVPVWLIAIVIPLLYAIMALFEIRGLGNRFIEFGIPSFLIVLLAIQLEPLFPRLNSVVAGVLIHIGDASYATYLSHTFVVESIKRFLPRLTNGLTIESPIGVAIAISFSIVAGGLIYILLDKPSVALSKNAFSALSKAMPKSRRQIR
jgi:exopolysaccharide production protein ExoZ